MNDTHQSTTDAAARLYKNSYGQESKLRYLAYVLVENRGGLIVASMATRADVYAERDAAMPMLRQRQKNRTQRLPVGADQAYGTQDSLPPRASWTAPCMYRQAASAAC